MLWIESLDSDILWHFESHLSYHPIVVQGVVTPLIHCVQVEKLIATDQIILNTWLWTITILYILTNDLRVEIFHCKILPDLFYFDFGFTRQCSAVAFGSKFRDHTRKVWGTLYDVRNQTWVSLFQIMPYPMCYCFSP